MLVHDSPNPLTVAEIARYWRNGYLVVSGVLPEGLCDEAVAHAMEFETARQQLFEPIIQPHRLNAWFTELLAYPPIVSLVEDILGEPPAGLQTLFYFCRPGTPGFILHQDNYCVEANDGDFLSTWIALTDVSHENGCLQVYPRTHTKGIYPVRRLDGDEINEQFRNMSDSPVFDPPDDPIDVPLCKGDLVILHGNTVHRSNPNLSNDFRFAHLNTYIRPGSPFRPGNTAQRSADPITLTRSIV